jgi:hypothetical protein
LRELEARKRARSEIPAFPGASDFQVYTYIELPGDERKDWYASRRRRA